MGADRRDDITHDERDRDVEASYGPGTSGRVHNERHAAEESESEGDGAGSDDGSTGHCASHFRDTASSAIRCPASQP